MLLFVDAFLTLQLRITAAGHCVRSSVIAVGSTYLTSSGLFASRTGSKSHAIEAHTPESNGIAEIRFRGLLNKARTRLFDSNSLKQRWVEALLAVVYLQNQTINVKIKQIPIEA